MFNDSIECYQAIAQEAISLLRNRDWREVRIECELDGSSTDILFEVNDAKGANDYVTEASRLPQFFHELARLVSTPDKGLYKVCRFVLQPSGRYSVDFEYQD